MLLKSVESKFNKLTMEELENIITKYGYTIVKKEDGWSAWSNSFTANNCKLSTHTYGGSNYYWALCQITAWIIISNANTQE